jgi:hypothetical protein
MFALFVFAAAEPWQIGLALLCPVTFVAVLGYWLGSDIYAWLRSLITGTEEDE